MREQTIQARIMLALSAAGCTVWRNNTGALKGPDGRLVRYGLCKGSSDLIGIAPGGVFFAVEVKGADGRVSPAQRRFIENVRKAGGRAGVARSVEDAIAIAMGATP